MSNPIREDQDVRYAFVVLSAIGIFVLSVFLGGKLIERRHSKREHIVAIRDQYAALDGRHKTLAHHIQRKSREIAARRERVEEKEQKLRALEAAYSEEGYAQYRAELAQHQRARSFDDYLWGLEIQHMLVKGRLESNAAKIAELEQELPPMEAEYASALAVVSAETARFQKEYAYELNPDLDPYDMVDLNYFLLSFCVIAMVTSFMTLVSISPASRYVAMSVGAIAAAGYLSKKKER